MHHAGLFHRIVFKVADGTSRASGIRGRYSRAVLDVLIGPKETGMVCLASGGDIRGCCSYQAIPHSVRSGSVHEPESLLTWFWAGSNK